MVNIQNIQSCNVPEISTYIFHMQEQYLQCLGSLPPLLLPTVQFLRNEFLSIKYKDTEKAKISALKNLANEQ